MNKQCNNCKNKDVCKWIDLLNSLYETYENTDKSAPIKIIIECSKRRL